MPSASRAVRSLLVCASTANSPACGKLKKAQQPALTNSLPSQRNKLYFTKTPFLLIHLLSASSLAQTMEIPRVMAARFEFEENANAKAARALLQNGLRINPESRELWLEYLRLELLYWEKMRMRAEILGLDTSEEEEATLAARMAEQEGGEGASADLSHPVADGEIVVKRNTGKRGGENGNDTSDDEDMDAVDAKTLAAQEAREASEFFEALTAGAAAAGATAEAEMPAAEPEAGALETGDALLGEW